MFHPVVSKSKHPFQQWQREMNRLFDRFNRDLDITDTQLDAVEPRVEIKEKANEYVVRAEIPGMSDKDLHVSLRDNCLILEGERKEETEKEEKGFYRSEFSYGSFYRAIPLDEEVNPDSVNAAYRDGILTVTLSKTGEGKTGEKIIPITLS